MSEGSSGRVPPAEAATPAVRSRVPRPGDLLLVALGGSVGGLARVALAEAFPTVPDAVPWVTLLENVTGALLLGLALTWLGERAATSTRVRLLVCTGALGAFTTYSTLATEVASRLRETHLLLGLGYATASVTLGLLAAFAGVLLGRSLQRHRSAR